MEDYVQLLLQKYRLAVVLAVLRNKPDNISVEDYIMELRNNILDSESQAISVHEDDFNISDEEINLNTLSLNIDDNSNESVTILQDFDNVLDKEEVLKLTNVDDETNSQASQNVEPTQPNAINTNLEFGTADKELKQIVENNLFKQNETNQSQSILTNADSLVTNTCFTENFTHISQSQDCMSVQANFITSDRNIDMKRKNVYTEDSEILVHVRKKIKPIVYTESIAVTDNTETYYETPQIQKDFTQTQIDHTNLIPVDTIKSTNNIIILENVSLKPKDNFNNSKEIFDSNTNFQTLEQSTRLNDTTNSQLTDNLFEPSQDITLSTNRRESIKKYEDIDFDIGNKCDSLYDPSQNMNDTLNLINNDNTQINVKKTRQNSLNEDLDETITKINKNTDEYFNDLHVNEITESQEVIPFKVMGELNKIKAYLNKSDFDSHGSDSGFKSRSSLYIASQSTHWLNQSSHCLFTYLTQTQFSDSTAEINYEIAKVLGELIDRLHENEKYPTFLEEMLEFIANLILTIYEGKCDANAFFKTDESIERLVLLNKSQNIIKFTIEKIVKILETFYQNLEKDDTIELTDINKTENLAYIFHLLELLLKKHTKLSQFSQNTRFSQSTKFSQSQEEKTLKRSTITEIWRKKWNLTKKEVFQKEEKNILVDCSDILNKIVVKAVNNYSLIAFAALQCFNLLQS